MPYAEDAYGREVEDVRTIFGGLEIVEAKADFLLWVTAHEHEHGVRGDAQNCMFSQACKRALGSRSVLFYPTVAYVDMIDPKDETRRVVMRFQLPKATRERLDMFDANREGFVEATFLLKAVSPANTLAARRKANRRSAAARAATEEKPTPEQRKRSETVRKGHATRERNRLEGIRTGSGKVKTSAG